MAATAETTSAAPVRLYHNPRCSKSRATLELLRQRGLEVQVIDYMRAPPSTDDIVRILGLLQMQPRELMRQAESEYAQLDLDNPALTPTELVATMVAHPILLQRPIVLCNGKAAIGRPPEAVLDIL